MHVQEARALLGVEPDADPKTVRRAYLRAVKKHKPERDPDGFQRVREAYELLKHYAPYLPAAPLPVASLPVAPPEPIEPAPASRPEVFEADERDPFAEPGLIESLGAAADPFAEPEAPAPEAEDSDEAVAVAESVEEARWRRLDALDAELIDAPSHERVARLEAALAEDPEMPEVREWLVDEYFDLGDADGLERHVRVLQERGSDFGLSMLAELAPDRVDDEDLDKLTWTEGAVRVLLDRGRLDDALKLIARERERELAQKHPFIGGQLERVLDLLDRGHADAAEEAYDALAEGLDEGGSGMRLADHDKMRLVLVGDLVAGWDDLDDEVREALWPLVRDPDAPGAVDAVIDLTAQRPAAARRAKELIGARAPALAQLVGAELDWSTPDAPAPVEQKKNAMPKFLIAVMLIVGVRVIFGLARSNDRPSYEPPPIPDYPAAGDLLGDPSPVHDGPGVGDAAVTICREGSDMACAAADRVERALNERRCPDAANALDDLRAAVGEDAPPPVTSARLSMSLAYLSWCPPERLR